MATKRKKTKTPQPYATAPSAVEKVREIKDRIEKILVENRMALAPIVTISGDKVVSRIDVISLDDKPTVG
jgi:hypothetical protein